MDKAHLVWILFTLQQVLVLLIEYLSSFNLLFWRWLSENQYRPDFIQALLRKSSDEQVVMSVDNPCYILRNKPLIKTFKNIRASFHENFSER